MHSRNLGTGVLALVLAAAALAPSAQAEPTDPGAPSVSEVRAAEDRSDAALSDVERVQQRLDEAAAEADAASVAAAKAAEAYNGARWTAAEARRAERKATRRSARAARVLEVQKDSYRDVVITARSAGVEISALNALITAEGVETLLERSSASGHVEALLDQRHEAYTAAAADAEDARSDARAAADEADAALDEAAAAKDTAQAAAADASAVAGRVERRKARLVRRLARLEGISLELAQERQDALEAERAGAREASPAPSPAPGPAGGSDPAPDRDEQPAPEPVDDRPADEPEPEPVVPDNPPAADGNGAAKAIAFARDQIGEPYVWAAAGPGSWDCSGLTSKAWAAGGKSLPHYSVAQYQQSTPITVGRLRPGDLVFWSDGGPGQIFHVALYAGSGRIIHAPRTGRPVTEESMYYWRTPDYFARP